MVRPAYEDDLRDIMQIYNLAVLETTGIWNDAMTDMEERHAWWLKRVAAGYPVFVADVDGEIGGYGVYDRFRPYDGFSRTVEHALYTNPRYQRRGVASAILEALIAKAQEDGYHVMLGGIAAENEPSLALHSKFGFIETGRLPQVGHKFGRWHDLVFMQKMLSEA
ncbi:MAG: N-acetyltransferase [Hyphomicrobiaceae bacterium]|nr:N-acetyltransferase [Hyphomicrobiaceae bacterium]